MAEQIVDYGRFHELYPDFHAVYINNDKSSLDVEEIRYWMSDASRLGDFYLTETSAYMTGLSDIVCLMSDVNTAFEYKMRWK